VDALTFVFTTDDAGSNGVELFQELLRFLQRRRVRGTFFTIPAAQGQPLDDRPDWIDALQKAHADGHEIGLHGYRHEGFEFGRPPDYMLDLMGPTAWERLQSKRQELHDAWRLESLQEKVEQGIAILERTLGIRPRSWRSPCCAVCTPLYQAMAAAGIAYDSSLIVNPQGWPLCAKDYQTRLDWEPAHPPYPFRYHAGVIEVPVVSEYTWYLEDDLGVEKAWELMVADYERAARTSGLFVVMTHFYAMTGQYRRGLDLYDRLFDYMEARGTVQYRTVAEAALLPPGPWPI
jgi:peptidoglycan/xylan/chitin deacetylase (PgdA/CDA1 family)